MWVFIKKQNKNWISGCWDIFVESRFLIFLKISKNFENSRNFLFEFEMEILYYVVIYDYICYYIDVYMSRYVIWMYDIISIYLSIYLYTNTTTLIWSAILRWVTTSRPICEVKQRQAGVVLRWVTTGEVLVLIIFFYPLLSTYYLQL